MNPDEQRKRDLEDHLHKDLNLLKELEDNFRYADYPKDKLRLQNDIDELNKQIAARKAEQNSLNLATQIPLKDFITLDQYLDSSNPRYWPKRRDMEAKRLYQPKNYIEEIQKNLVAHKRCLLVGKSASGKTTLAIAFGLWWRDEQQNQNQHPEVGIFYLDADTSRAERDETGEDWYQQICAHDHQNELFIIDNCHLGSAAVSAFCDRWERQPPKQALVLLISAPKVSESDWDDEPEDYFYSFKQIRAILEVQPKQIYKGVIQAYSYAYCLINPELFVPVEQDFDNRERTKRLEQLCTHNLAATRSILEAWGNLGGWLSDVTEEHVLKGLERRYLRGKKVKALVPMCSLAQFEIPADDCFVCDRLPEESVKELQDENWIVAKDSSSYGVCHRLTFHPKVAAQIFRAYVMRRRGNGYKDYVEDEIFFQLKAYLSTRPVNFIQVYHRLYRNGAVELQHRLLRDTELQTHAAGNFAKRLLYDVIFYLYILSRIEPSRSQTLLRNLINHIGVEEFRKQMLALTGRRLAWVIFRLAKLSLDSTSLVFSDVSPETLGQKLNGQTMALIGRVLNLLRKLGYSRAFLQQIIQVLTLNTLAQKAEQGSLQTLARFLNNLIYIDHEQAKLFVEKLSPETFRQRLSQSISSIGMVFNVLRKLDNNQVLRKRLADALDITELAIKAQDASLQKLFWLVRHLKDISPKQAERLLTHITPAGLAKKLRAEQATVKNLDHFLQVSNYYFIQDCLRQLNDEEIVAIFERSKLGKIGSLLQWRFRQFEQFYSMFATANLGDKLPTAEIKEVSKFITRLQSIPQEGKRLAIQVLELLIDTDLTARVANTDVEQLAVLLLNADLVERSYSWFLISTLVSSGAVEEAIKHSRIRGIQLLLRNLSEIAPEFLPSIGESLQNLDLTNRIAKAEVKDLRHFLWNVRQYVGEELAKTYCEMVDAQLSSKQMANADLSELAGLLWNLVHISGMDNLQTLNQPVLLKRLENEWDTYPGHCAWILGVLLVVHPQMAQAPSFLSFSFKYIEGKLAEWLTNRIDEGNPYIFALTVKALRARNKHQAVKVVQRSLSKSFVAKKCSTLLQEAVEKAETPRSREVLQETIRFVQQLTT
ncbi:hypothetical protein F7734_42785 [Scytonema sp. UIC 10036]|uniref:hypothetical protein n=1 Tax=Scytonema sp. UIC 10036 TaxID=2304196 RepID=UPI0012DAA3D4|nr:hypothetical protein [Scytonema sp. UIC 10036]MUG98662.1 hypothetical protein [Scytonema sp. UIC 10036]